METIYRQKRPSRLTPEQLEMKVKKDAEYEIDVQNLSTPFYDKKRSEVGVSPQEEANYLKAKSRLWNNYREWAITKGLYEEVTPEQQLVEAEEVLHSSLEKVNDIRKELEKEPMTVAILDLGEGEK